jgi:two-component system, LuxR family, response regulator FixJ
MTGLNSQPRPLVVLVEGDLAVTHAIEFAFGLEGLRIRSYQTGAAALGDEQSRRAGCIVLDSILPDMDGLDLLARLRANGVTTPAVVIATNPRSALRERARIAGAPIIEKPLLNDGLLDAVRQALAIRASPSAAASGPIPTGSGPSSWS